MIKTGTVKVRKKQRECRFFPSSQINNHEKAILVALRKKGHRKILFFIKEKEGHFSEICRHIGLAPSTTSHKLDSLVRAGIVEFRYKNKIKIFKIKDPTITLRTIKQYQDWIKITER